VSRGVAIQSGAISLNWPESVPARDESFAMLIWLRIASSWRADRRPLALPHLRGAQDGSASRGQMIVGFTTSQWAITVDAQVARTQRVSDPALTDAVERIAPSRRRRMPIDDLAAHARLRTAVSLDLDASSIWTPGPVSPLVPDEGATRVVRERRPRPLQLRKGRPWLQSGMRSG
jgi:hypothetical protein